MKNKIPTKKYLILSILSLVIVVAISVFAIIFINSEKAKVTELSNELMIASREDVVALKRAIRNYETSADAVADLLVDKNDVFSFINEVELLAENSGAEAVVENIDLFDVVKNGELVRYDGKENPERTHGKFLMNMKVDGSWEAVAGFLLKMENFPKHTLIDALRLNSVIDPETQAQTWSANFNIITTTN